MIRIPDSIRSAMHFEIGDPDRIDDAPEPPFGQLRIGFLADLAKVLMAGARSREFPDVATLGFWCRRANIESVAQRHDTSAIRMGLGAVFHITPSNVPINFAYSLVFSFLAGNSSIVRLSSHGHPQTGLVLEALKAVLAEDRYSALRPAIQVIRYDRNDAVTEFWLQNTLGHIVWGGNATIGHIRSLKSHPRAREVAFADRYSLAAMEARHVLHASEQVLGELCSSLYNDVYLMDQRACTSPQLLIWVGSNEEIAAARARLWPAFLEYARKKYSPAPIHAMDKFVDLCREAIDYPNIAHVDIAAPTLTRITLDSLSAAQTGQRGYYGTIHEYPAESLDAIAPCVDSRYQTMTYFGFDVETLRHFLSANHLPGIDRIVPVGQALSMGFLWDGFDIISNLTRHIDIQ